MQSSGVWSRVGFLRTEFSGERIASIFMVEEIYESEQKY
jgi:hypothetical protein